MICASSVHKLFILCRTSQQRFCSPSSTGDFYRTIFSLRRVKALLSKSRSGRKPTSCSPHTPTNTGVHGPYVPTYNLLRYRFLSSIFLAPSKITGHRSRCNFRISGGASLPRITIPIVFNVSVIVLGFQSTYVATRFRLTLTDALVHLFCRVRRDPVGLHRVLDSLLKKWL